jgi:pilus biogenesis lipoprotein CpaD
MKCRGNHLLIRAFLVRALSFSAAAALTLNPALTPVVASDYRVMAPVASDGQMNSRFLALGVGKSVVIDLPRDIKDVLVADPKIANAVIRSSQRAYIIGAAVGQTNIVFFDSAGQQIAAYDIAVKRDLNGVRAALRQTLPNADIQIEGVGDGTIRLSYPKISAIAGPCGLWPEDIGPSINNKSYFDNKQYFNFGCAYQRNMAAMVDNPSDLVQPRSETLAYTTRRTVAFEKYRKGTATTTLYPEADKAKLSDTGK